MRDNITSTHKNLSLPRKKRRFQLSKAMYLVLSFLWGKEDKSHRKPYEADYSTLAKSTGLSKRTLEWACSRLKREGWLQRVVLNPFSHKGIPKIVWRIPYGQFDLIKRVLNAEGNKADPIILSVIRRTHNPMRREELQDILNMKRRTLQRSLSRLVDKGELERYTSTVWTSRSGWKKRTFYRLPSKAFKDMPITHWTEKDD